MTRLLGELFSIEQDFTLDEVKQRAGLQQLLASDGSCVLVAEFKQRVVGMCSVQTLVSTAEGGKVGLLEDLVIDRDYRGQGIGQNLLQALEQWAAVHGIPRLQLLADRHNHEALAFYRNRGWSETSLLGLRKFITPHQPG